MGFLEVESFPPVVPLQVLLVPLWTIVEWLLLV